MLEYYLIILLQVYTRVITGVFMRVSTAAGRTCARNHKRFSGAFVVFFFIESTMDN